MKGGKISYPRLTVISPSDDLGDHHIPHFFITVFLVKVQYLEALSSFFAALNYLTIINIF